METGLRVFLGLGVLQVVAIIALIGALTEPGPFLRGAARDLASGGERVPLFLALWSLATTFLAARRLAPATRGWLLSLPISPFSAWFALGVALLTSQALVIATWVLLWIGGLLLGGSARMSALLSVAVVAVGAAAAAVLAYRGGGRSAKSRLLRDGVRAPGFTPAVIAWRALGPGVLGNHLFALLMVGGGLLVLRNNPDMTMDERGVAVRAAGGLAAFTILHRVGTRLVVRRPPWPWSRSLPWSAHARVLADTAFLAAHAVPVLLATIVLHPSAVPTVAALAAFVAVRIAGAMRVSVDRMTSLGWRIQAEALLAVIGISVSSWVSLFLLALIPLAWRSAVRDDQKWKVSLLHERQYAASGDPTC